jgi:hypothetical protein
MVLACWWWRSRYGEGRRAPRAALPISGNCAYVISMRSIHFKKQTAGIHVEFATAMMILVESGSFASQANVIVNWPSVLAR